MKKIKIYLDTNVIGNLDEQTSPEEMSHAHALWADIKQGKYDVVISDVVLDEINDNKNLTKVKTLTSYLNEITFETILLNDEIEHIADQVKKLGLITGKKQLNDRRHIGCALVSRSDVLVSNNFKHLVNAQTIFGVKKVAIVEGYGFIEIFTPQMLLIAGGK